MIRNRKWISYFLAALLLVQIGIGGFAAKPSRVSAASDGPVIVSTSPSTTAANVPVNAKLILTFDENVMKGSGPATIYIRRLTDNALFQSYVVSSDNRVSIGSTRNIVTITPSANFDVNTSYYVSIDGGAFVNEGNSANFTGLSSTLAWNFTTVAAADTTPPTLTATTPANGGTASISTTLTMTFNEPVYAASGNITISNIDQPGDVRTISVVSTSVSGSATPTITVQIPTVLQGSRNYEVTIPAGAFKDGAGNSAAEVTTGQWRFATTVPPLGDPALSPQTNSFAVPVETNLTMTFPSAVAVNAGNIRINKISDNSTVQTIAVTSGNVSIADKTVTIDPADLAANTGFYILIDAGAFKDAGDGTILYQGIADARTWTFVTNPGNDTTPPTLLSERKPLNVQATPTLNLELNFSEPVYPGAGNIIIKTSAGNIFTTIPVTSDKLNGGGTTKITVVDPSITFVNNTTYYVEIGGQAFSDAKGNYYAGLSGSTGWSFTVTQDSVKPTIVTQTPTNLTTGIGLTGIKLEALFSEQILLGSDPAAVKVKRITGTNTTPLTTTLSIDPQNNRKLIIAINGLLTGSTDYYVEMAEGAVTDMAGNRFEGILNQYQWTFSTLNSSNGTPSVSKAELTGMNKIAITFTDVLDASSVPVSANFYVTVNGAGRSVTDVQINNQILTLTLQNSVVNGQIIKVSYSAGTKPIKGLNGVPAANFSNRDVTNTPDNTIPRQLNATLGGNMVILTFSEELASINSSAYSQFTVYVDGSTRSVTQISGSGTVAFLTFNGNAVTNGQSVSLSYYGSSYPLRDLSGNAVPSFSSFYVQNGLDNKAPILQSVTAATNKVTLVYDETLNAAFLPNVSAFYVTVNGVVRAVASITISGSQVVLTLASSINAGESVYVSYLGGTPALVDNGGNSVPAFSGLPANGIVNAASPSLSGATVKGSTLTLTFSAQLNSTYIPSSTQFTVKVNNVSRPVSSVTINGAAVTVNLFTPAASGEAVKISYNASGVPIRSLTGGQVAAFNEIIAANQTTWADNMNGDFEAAAGGGLSIKAAAATKGSGYSPAGRSANQYVLSADKILAAFNTIRTVSGMSPRVVFTVPESEAAGLVAISLSALEEAKKTVSDGSIAIVYKDTSYEIPLSALNFSQLAQMANANSAVGQLVVAIDMNATNLASGLTAALNSTSAQMLVSPVSFELSVNSNGQSKTLDTLSSYITRTIKTAANLDGRQTAVVWLDPQTNKLSYVPTQVTQDNGMSIVTFKRKGNSVYTIIKGAIDYADVAKHWARNDILLLANKYIVEGNTLTAFAPDKAITRGEFAMFIAKGLGLNGDKQAAAKFKDVNTSTTLSAYIGAASNAGIVQGMTDGTFMPNRTVTREEMASMMVRAASAAGTQISLSSSSTTILKKFKDSTKIGTWAQSDVAKAVQMEIINGMSNGTFGGKTTASRAQAAVMVKRLLDYVNFIDV